MQILDVLIESCVLDKYKKTQTKEENPISSLSNSQTTVQTK